MTIDDFKSIPCGPLCRRMPWDGEQGKTRPSDCGDRRFPILDKAALKKARRLAKRWPHIGPSLYEPCPPLPGW